MILIKIYYAIPCPSIESLKMKTTLLSKVTEYLHIFHLLNILSPPIYTLFFSAIKSTWGLCYLKKQEDNKKKDQMLWSNNLLKEEPTFLTSCSLLHPCGLAATSPSAETSSSSSVTKQLPHTYSSQNTLGRAPPPPKPRPLWATSYCPQAAVKPGLTEVIEGSHYIYSLLT